MGTIEDIRKVIQDLVTPDLRAIALKLEMIEKHIDRMDGRLDRMDGRIDRLDGRIDDLFERAERNADARMNQLLVALGHEDRIKRLEEARQESKEQ